MSLYLSARYPDLIGSASAFNPGPEFYAGEKGRRLLWRPKDHVGNPRADDDPADPRERRLYQPVSRGDP